MCVDQNYAGFSLNSYFIHIKWQQLHSGMILINH